MADKIKRVEWLLSHIHKWDEAYFNDNKPLISDEEYDKYYFELDDLLKDEDVIKALGKRDMPLGVQSSYLDKVKHLVKVLSLDKIKIDGPKFQNQLKNFVKKYDTGQGWVIESKEDGLTLMNYKAKNSATFATRGQSDKGENVTNQLAFDKDLTEAIEATPEAMIIRGEGLINNKTFETIVATQDKTITDALTALEVVLEPEHVTVCNGYLLGESSKSDMTKVKSYYKSNKSVQKLISDFITVVDNKYASARNLASASLRTKDETMSSQNNVEFVTYDIINSFKFGLATELECLEKLKELGYKVVRIPYFIQLSNKVVKSMFGKDIDEPLFDESIPSMGVKEQNTPAYCCPLGIKRMAREFNCYPEQYRSNLKALQNENDDFLTGALILEEEYRKAGYGKTK